MYIPFLLTPNLEMYYLCLVGAGVNLDFLPDIIKPEIN